eukprot:7469442-Ditylum_brightwellii.AAC.1
MAYQQQKQLLIQQGKENPDPSVIWDEDMLRFLDIIPKEDKIILAMDANGGIGDTKLGKFLSSTWLVDSIGATHRMNAPPTYIG